MPDFRCLPVQSCLPHRVISKLDEVASDCFTFENPFTKRNCVLALAQLYFCQAEVDRAGHLLEMVAGDEGGDGIPSAVPKLDRGDNAGQETTHWDVQQARLSLQKAEVLLESGKLDLAIDQLLEARLLLRATHTGEDAVDENDVDEDDVDEDAVHFVSTLWLALALKWTTAKAAHLAANWEVRAIGRLSKQLDDLLPGRQWDAWCYLGKVWYFLGMDAAEAEEMLSEVVIPSLAECGQWPGLRLRAWSAEALLAAHAHSAERAMNALSKAEQSAIEGRDVLYQKFYLLVRMEAMVMLDMDEAARQAKRDFLSDSGLTHLKGHQSAAESRRNDDAFWAQHDPTVEESYAGQWVVPFERHIVAHGADLDTVLEEAARVTQQSKDELLACAIPHPDDWLADV